MKYFLIFLMSVCMFVVVPAYAQELNFGINDRVFVDEQTLVISGKTSPGNEIAIKLHGTDETIKVFEQIVVNDSGSFGYDFTWPKDSVDYPYGIYTLEIIDLSQNVAYESVEIEFTPKKWEQGIRNKLVEPPLKQFKDGMTFQEINCKSYLQKIIKHDSTPVCVKPETIPKLIERGWTSNITKAGQSGKISSNLEDATSSYMDRIIPTLDDFKNVLSEPYNMDTIFSKFGEPYDDIGSGIHIYVYELNDFTEIWIGYVDDIWYVKHVDANGIVLEELFVKNLENPKDCPISFSSRCITGTITEIFDGDNVRVGNVLFRLTLVSPPELDEIGGQEAKALLEEICPVGSDALVDQDDLRPLEHLTGTGRIMTVVYCNGLNLNEELVEHNFEYFDGTYCYTSEFADDPWAKEGCSE